MKEDVYFIFCRNWFVCCQHWRFDGRNHHCSDLVVWPETPRQQPEVGSLYFVGIMNIYFQSEIDFIMQKLLVFLLQRSYVFYT